MWICWEGYSQEERCQYVGEVRMEKPWKVLRQMLAKGECGWMCCKDLEAVREMWNVLRRLRCGQKGVECGLRRRARGEISSSSAGVASPPVPRPANRRGLRGLDARQIVLLLILPSEHKHPQPPRHVSYVGSPKVVSGWMCGRGWMVSLEAGQQV